MAEIRTPEAPHLAGSQACHNGSAGIPLKAYGVDFQEGRSLFAIKQGTENLAGIEHRSYAPTFHDALDCRACLCCELHQMDNCQSTVGNRRRSRCCRETEGILRYQRRSNFPYYENEIYAQHGKTLRMARVEALIALNTINSAEAEQVEPSFARGWEPAGYSHRRAEVIPDGGQAVFHATDRVKLGGFWRRLLNACIGGGLIAGGLLLTGTFSLGRNW